MGRDPWDQRCRDGAHFPGGRNIRPRPHHLRLGRKRGQGGHGGFLLNWVKSVRCHRRPATPLAALHSHLPKRHGGEQCWHWLLHRDAVHHAPPRHHFPRPLRVLDHLPLLSGPSPKNKGIHSLWTTRLAYGCLNLPPPSSPSTLI